MREQFGAEKINNDAVYTRDKNPERLKEIENGLNSPKQISFDYEGEKVTLEYIEVPAKENSGKEKTIIILPGFGASFKPYTETVKELSQYIGDYRVICLSPFDSGKSSSLKGSNLGKMTEAYNKAFEQLGINPNNSEVTVVGHSRSDIIALNLAGSHPETVKNAVLVNGISANPSGLPKLTYDFLKHTQTVIAPERLKGFFNGEEETAKNYLKQNMDFLSNVLKPKPAFNQFKSLAERKKIDLDALLSQLKSNVLVLSGSNELTNYQETSEKIYNNLPDSVGKQHRIEADGLHDEINAHPEAFALKLKRWLESLEKK